MYYRIYPLNTGYLFTDNAPPCNDEPGPNSGCHVPATAFLVTDGDHHLLVDTGMPDTTETLKHRPYSAQPEGFDIVHRLREKGLSPDRLEAIIISHLHWDHCAYMEHFPRVRKIIQNAEVVFASAPPATFLHSYQNSHIALSDPHLDIIDGRYQYNSLITLIPTPGHSLGHQAVEVQTGVDTFILAGDAAWFEKNQGISVPRKAVHPAAAKQSFHMLRKLGKKLLSSHDPSVLKHSVYG